MALPTTSSHSLSLSPPARFPASSRRPSSVSFVWPPACRVNRPRLISLRASSFSDPKSCKMLQELQQLHAHRIKTGQIWDPYAAAEILCLSALSDFRDLDYARSVFESMGDPNCFSWNTIIRAFAESDRPRQALLLYCRMVAHSDIVPNRFTFPSVLKACAEMAGTEEGQQVHGHIVKWGLEADTFVLSNLLRVYVTCGMMEKARQLFERSFELDEIGSEDAEVVMWNVMVDRYLRMGDILAAGHLFNEMPRRSVISWNGMIAGYAQNGFFKEALDIFREMQMSNVSPNYVTLVGVLPAISRLGALDLGKWVHAYAEKNKIQVDEVLGSALIDMYSKCGSIDKALQLFEGLPQKNVITWNAIIGGLAMHGHAKDALTLYSQMEDMGATPTDVTFVGALSACSHAGLVDEGCVLFNKMVKTYGLKPRVEHYGCMVDLFGRAGLLEKAEDFVLNMPMKPDDVIWKALLGACKIHGNIEMGKRIASRLMELAPNDSGSYVLLSNIHASLGNWDDVAKVRLIMKEMVIRKDPGCSSIAMDGSIHEFRVEDNSHPRSEEIHSMLGEMAQRLKSIGYIPDTSQVLLNIDEEEKEGILYYHSEKIAIAFGLISTRPNTTLRIVKSLRICNDCHSSIKLISKLYNRKIIVRDRSRFHHFENGFCSCMGYW